MSNRIPLIAGNWKMYKTGPEAVAEARKLVAAVGGLTDRQAMIAPTFTALSPVHEVLKGTSISLGAQDLYWEKEGAFTGEISAPMIVSTGCSHVIIGHSERRQYFGETDETVNKKTGAALATGLIPVVCVGESVAERDADQTFSVLDKQITKGLNSYLPENLATLVIAYEPIWAIGTGKTATPEIAQETHRFIRETMEKNFGDPLAASIRILYGGSVKPDNVDSLMEKPDIDGALVGGASLDAETFSKIIHFKVN
jgi:triosephosphate isomerase